MKLKQAFLLLLNGLALGRSVLPKSSIATTTTELVSDLNSGHAKQTATSIEDLHVLHERSVPTPFTTVPPFIYVRGPKSTLTKTVTIPCTDEYDTTTTKVVTTCKMVFPDVTSAPSSSIHDIVTTLVISTNTQIVTVGVTVPCFDECYVPTRIDDCEYGYQIKTANNGVILSQGYELDYQIEAEYYELQSSGVVASEARKSQEIPDMDVYGYHAGIYDYRHRIVDNEWRNNAGHSPANFPSGTQTPMQHIPSPSTTVQSVAPSVPTALVSDLNMPLSTITTTVTVPCSQETCTNAGIITEYETTCYYLVPAITDFVDTVMTTFVSTLVLSSNSKVITIPFAVPGTTETPFPKSTNFLLTEIIETASSETTYTPTSSTDKSVLAKTTPALPTSTHRIASLGTLNTDLYTIVEVEHPIASANLTISAADGLLAATTTTQISKTTTQIDISSTTAAVTLLPSSTITSGYQQPTTVPTYNVHFYDSDTLEKSVDNAFWAESWSSYASYYSAFSDFQSNRYEYYYESNYGGPEYAYSSWYETHWSGYTETSSYTYTFGSEYRYEFDYPLTTPVLSVPTPTSTVPNSILTTTVVVPCTQQSCRDLKTVTEYTTVCEILIDRPSSAPCLTTAFTTSAVIVSENTQLITFPMVVPCTSKTYPVSKAISSTQASQSSAPELSKTAVSPTKSSTKQEVFETRSYTFPMNDRSFSIISSSVNESTAPLLDISSELGSKTESALYSTTLLEKPSTQASLLIMNLSRMTPSGTSYSAFSSAFSGSSEISKSIMSPFIPPSMDTTVASHTVYTFESQTVSLTTFSPPPSISTSSGSEHGLYESSVSQPLRSESEVSSSAVKNLDSNTFMPSRNIHFEYEKSTKAHSKITASLAESSASVLWTDHHTAMPSTLKTSSKLPTTSEEKRASSTQSPIASDYTVKQSEYSEKIEISRSILMSIPSSLLTTSSNSLYYSTNARFSPSSSSRPTKSISVITTTVTIPCTQVTCLNLEKTTIYTTVCKLTVQIPENAHSTTLTKVTSTLTMSGNTKVITIPVTVPCTSSFFGSQTTTVATPSLKEVLSTPTTVTNQRSSKITSSTYINSSRFISTIPLYSSASTKETQKISMPSSKSTRDLPLSSEIKSQPISSEVGFSESNEISRVESLSSTSKYTSTTTSVQKSSTSLPYSTSSFDKHSKVFQSDESRTSESSYPSGISGILSKILRVSETANQISSHTEYTRLETPRGSISSTIDSVIKSSPKETQPAIETKVYTVASNSTLSGGETLSATSQSSREFVPGSKMHFRQTASNTEASENGIRASSSSTPTIRITTASSPKSIITTTVVIPCSHVTCQNIGSTTKYTTALEITMELPKKNQELITSLFISTLVLSENTKVITIPVTVPSCSTVSVVETKQTPKPSASHYRASRSSEREKQLSEYYSSSSSEQGHHSGLESSNLIPLPSSASAYLSDSIYFRHSGMTSRLAKTASSSDLVFSFRSTSDLSTLKETQTVSHSLATLEFSRSGSSITSTSQLTSGSFSSALVTPQPPLTTKLESTSGMSSFQSIQVKSEKQMSPESNYSGTSVLLSEQTFEGATTSIHVTQVESLSSQVPSKIGTTLSEHVPATKSISKLSSILLTMKSVVVSTPIVELTNTISTSDIPHNIHVKSKSLSLPADQTVVPTEAVLISTSETSKTTSSLESIYYQSTTMETGPLSFDSSTSQSLQDTITQSEVRSQSVTTESLAPSVTTLTTVVTIPCSAVTCKNLETTTVFTTKCEFVFSAPTSAATSMVTKLVSTVVVSKNTKVITVTATVPCTTSPSASAIKIATRSSDSSLLSLSTDKTSISSAEVVLNTSKATTPTVKIHYFDKTSTVSTSIDHPAGKSTATNFVMLHERESQTQSLSGSSLSKESLFSQVNHSTHAESHILVPKVSSSLIKPTELEASKSTSLHTTKKKSVGLGLFSKLTLQTSSSIHSRVFAFPSTLTTGDKSSHETISLSETSATNQTLGSSGTISSKSSASASFYQVSSQGESRVNSLVASRTTTNAERVLSSTTSLTNLTTFSRNFAFGSTAEGETSTGSLKIESASPELKSEGSVPSSQNMRIISSPKSVTTSPETSAPSIISTAPSVSVTTLTTTVTIPCTYGTCANVESTTILTTVCKLVYPAATDTAQPMTSSEIVSTLVVSQNTKVLTMSVDVPLITDKSFYLRTTSDSQSKLSSKVEVRGSVTIPEANVDLQSRKPTTTQRQLTLETITLATNPTKIENPFCSELIAMMTFPCIEEVCETPVYTTPVTILVPKPTDTGVIMTTSIYTTEVVVNSATQVLSTSVVLPKGSMVIPGPTKLAELAKSTPQSLPGIQLVSTVVLSCMDVKCTTSAYTTQIRLQIPPTTNPTRCVTSIAVVSEAIVSHTQQTVCATVTLPCGADVIPMEAAYNIIATHAQSSSEGLNIPSGSMEIGESPTMSIVMATMDGKASQKDSISTDSGALQTSRGSVMGTRNGTKNFQMPPGFANAANHYEVSPFVLPVMGVLLLLMFVQ